MAAAEDQETHFEGSLVLPPEIYKHEVAAITARRGAVGLRPPPNGGRLQPEPAVNDGLVGLALSGGGIRSATFSLGVMQALAAKDYLRYVDYLSTVSGGGYIGGSLTWLIHSTANASAEDEKGSGSQDGPNPPFGTRPGNLPYGVSDPRRIRPSDSKDPVMLRHLREHGKYLAPGGGITLTSLIAVILRGIVLNFLVWLPLAVALMVVALFGSHALSLYGAGELDWRAIEQAVGGGTLRHGRLGTLLLMLAGFLACVFVIVSIGYALASSASEGQKW